MIRRRSGRFVVEVYDPRVGAKRTVRPKDYGVPTPKTTREARALERMAFADLERHSRSAGDMTVDEFYASWMIDFPRGEATIKHNNERVKRFAEDFKGRKMSSVTKHDAIRWANENRARVPEVRAMFNDAVRAEVCKDNPFTGIGVGGRKGGGRKGIEVLSEGEVQLLADTAVDVHGSGFGEEFRAMILWAAFTGMRPGEIFAARWSNLNGDVYDVTEQFHSKLRYKTEPKHGSTGRILVPPTALQAVKDRPLRLRDDLMFRTKRGKPFSAGSLRYAWVPVKAAFGRPHMDFYELRHFCASYMLNELKIEPWIIAEQLRHSDGGALILATYGHPNRDRTLDRVRGAYGANVTQLYGAEDGANNEDVAG